MASELAAVQDLVAQLQRDAGAVAVIVFNAQGVAQSTCGLTHGLVDERGHLIGFPTAPLSSDNAVYQLATKGAHALEESMASAGITDLGCFVYGVDAEHGVAFLVDCALSIKLARLITSRDAERIRSVIAGLP